MRPIAFNSNLENPQGEIYLVRPDGSGLRRLTVTSPGGSGFPDWSPDSTHLAFNSNRDGKHQIYVTDADGREPRRLGRLEGDDFQPDWSPDGSRLAFVSDRDGVPTIYAMAADGSDVGRVTREDARDHGPRWSPDGSRIAFYSATRGGGPMATDDESEIYVMDADGRTVRRLTWNGSGDIYPAWLPDGRILFSSKRTGRWEAFVMEADGSGTVRLTDTPGDGAWGSWLGFPSPDGAFVALMSDRDDPGGWRGMEIYVMRADGSDIRRVTRNAVFDGHPAW